MEFKTTIWNTKHATVARVITGPKGGRFVVESAHFRTSVFSFDLQDDASVKAARSKAVRHAKELHRQREENLAFIAAECAKPVPSGC